MAPRLLGSGPYRHAARRLEKLARRDAIAASLRSRESPQMELTELDAHSHLQRAGQEGAGVSLGGSHPFREAASSLSQPLSMTEAAKASGP